MLYVILIVALLAFVSISNYIASRNMESESDAIVNDAIPISKTTNSLLTDLINQETSIRGFELTGSEQYLDPYTAGKNNWKQIWTTSAFMIKVSDSPAHHGYTSHTGHYQLTALL